ncbi:hypothetical protein WISP_18558 [Willisornis vidua]|uniref:Uncharacterized protein n=1 Tax=Willisornis vidua TaxID=1566151 RepID=A0ABQ9DPM8_9PASS|nr:hypothetical protein WISP_18558 [Willisornis vidua]
MGLGMLVLPDFKLRYLQNQSRALWQLDYHLISKKPKSKVTIAWICYGVTERLAPSAEELLSPNTFGQKTGRESLHCLQRVDLVTEAETSSHEAIEFKIPVDRRKSASKTSTLYMRRTDFRLLRELVTGAGNSQVLEIKQSRQKPGLAEQKSSTGDKAKKKKVYAQGIKGQEFRDAACYCREKIHAAKA